MVGDKLVGSKKAIKAYAKAEAALAAASRKRILPVSSKVKSYVKRTINNNMETKIAVKEVFNRIAVPGAGLDTSNGLGLCTTAGIIPALTRNDSDADRTGEEVTAKKLVLKYSIRARDISGTTNPFRQPFMVRVICFNQRFALDEASQTGIIDKGATAGNLDSSPDSWLEPYNKKVFKIHYSKTFKMAPLIDGTVNPVQIQNMPNGHLCWVAKTTTIKVPKKLLYNGNQSIPTNAQPQLAIAVCNIDGTPVSQLNYRVEFNAETQLYYTDA